LKLVSACFFFHVDFGAAFLGLIASSASLVT